ncbi:RIP metalloprotease RseP [Fulvivirgaceae bacterium BMA10]|uniref:Zinc metalloprotease n=1 Tax=Splendidivirga corallicola TaxID=3051826 RepID=A0ABT8KJD3_9BACT|nr:RIP metalloprotease RseP [Fulvivirgaceae bacterium BMA10]
MEILVMAAQLILGLSILVGLHEFGHLIAAKMFGMRVEKFSIGFPPKIFGVKFGETEYSFGAIPLGGFVKISGMIDESLDTENMSEEPQPWEFRSKPAWQRLIVMLGGIIMNVVLGIFIFIIIAYQYGETYYSKEEVNKYGINPSELAEGLGLREGDKIIKVNGEDYDRISDTYDSDVILATNAYYIVERDGKEVRIDIPDDFLNKLADSDGRESLIQPLQPFKILRITNKEGGANKAGLQAGDYIVSVNGIQTEFFHQLRRELGKNKGKEVNIKYRRDGTEKEVLASIDKNGAIGFEADILLKRDTVTYSFIEAIPAGTVQAFKIIGDQLKAFRKIFRGDVNASKSLSGPIEIAKKLYGGIWHWLNFWTMTGLLSMVLAFMNLLPIPALDGGHVMFLLYEIVSGRKPGDKFLEVAQKVGMVLLLCLMAFAIFNDVFKAFT